MTEQESCERCAGLGWYVLDVPPTDGRFGKPIRCTCRRQGDILRLAEQLRGRAGVSEADLKNYSFGTFDLASLVVAPGTSAVAVRRQMQRVYDACVAWAASPRNMLVLSGPVGCGKTHLAFAIVGALLEAKVPVFWATVPDLLDVLRGAIGAGDYEQQLQTVRAVQVLVLDDLGVQHDTSWAQQVLFQVIDWRWRYALPTVVTTNVPLDVRNPGVLGARLTSRLLDARNVLCPCSAGDHRMRSKEGGTR